MAVPVEEAAAEAPTVAEGIAVVFSFGATIDGGDPICRGCIIMFGMVPALCPIIVVVPSIFIMTGTIIMICD